MEKRGYQLQEFVAHESSVNCVNFGKKTCRLFATGGEDCKVNIWTFGKSTSLLSLSGHTSSVESVNLDTTEVLLLAGSSNGTIKLWDLEAAKIVRTLTGHRSSCTSVQFHPFGVFFASGSSDTDLKIWDMRKKGCIHTYKGHTHRIRTTRFTPDGQWVVTGGDDNSVKLWDLTAGKLLHDFKFHAGQIWCIDFHPHEFLLATGSSDRTVKFWDLETFELIGSAGPEATGVCSMIFHPDGRTLFCGLEETLKVFSWEPIRCHDVVDIGWSTLGDLAIADGKLLGCSYHQNRVGVWVADISLIGPYGVTVMPKTNELMEPLNGDGEKNSCVLQCSEKSIATVVVEVDSGIKTKEKTRSPFRSSNHCDQSALKGMDSSNGSNVMPIKSSGFLRNGVNASCHVVQENMVPVSMPVILPRETAGLETATKASTEIFHAKELCQPFHMQRTSFPIGDVHNQSTAAADRSLSEASGGFEEKIKRIVSLEQPVVSRGNQYAEPESSCSETSSVKYVKGVAVPLGKTLSLVESWERRERCNNNYSASISPSSDAINKKGRGQTSTKDSSSADDDFAPETFLQTHDIFINVARSRLTKLQVVRHFWEQSGVTGAINAIWKLPDYSVQVDVIGVLIENVDLFTLELFSCLLPVLAGLLHSKTERYVIISVEMLVELIKIFGPVVRSTISASSLPIGVDLQADQRLMHCKQILKLLDKIKQILPSVIRKGGLLAKHAQELRLALGDV